MAVITRLQSEKASKKVITKSQLSAHYQIDRGTLSKWLILFCKDIFENENVLLNRRKFSHSEVDKIKERLGSKPRFFWKADLIEISEASYKTIRENIEQYPLVYGITKHTYRSLDKFPPKIGQQILDGLG
jgi:hypothetical protein